MSDEREKFELEDKKCKDALEEVKHTLAATQMKLIALEKLASLGQLSAGIAHEIKNPLNFVNNFSELSMELIEEINEELKTIEDSPAKNNIIDILNDVNENLKKVHHHGSRADGIVKSMLMHSRGGTGEKEKIDLNEMIKEYVNLAFHGMRANKKAINVKIDLALDLEVGQVRLNPEEFSRVILNLCNNAFDTLREKIYSLPESEQNDFHALLTVQTICDGNQIVIIIRDNGMGVSSEIKDKILEPFFTTKKGKEGTGLGLSITNDIIKDHGGTIVINSDEGVFTEFVITIPKNKK